MGIEERLGRLERQNRRLRLAIGGILLGLVAAVTVAQGTSPAVDQLTVNRLTVTGELRVEAAPGAELSGWSVTPEGAQWHGDAGWIEIGHRHVDPASGSHTIIMPAGVRLLHGAANAWLACDGDGPATLGVTWDRHHYLLVGAGAAGASLMVARMVDKKLADGMQLSCDDAKGARLSVRDREQRVRAVLGRAEAGSKTEAATLTLYDDGGEVIERLPK